MCDERQGSETQCKKSKSLLAKQGDERKCLKSINHEMV